MIPTLDQLEQLDLHATEKLLLCGGDARLTIAPDTGVNKYGCLAQPDTDLIAFGSSTGSTISERGFAAATALHQRLISQDSIASEGALYRHELERIRMDFNRLCELPEQSGSATIFAASGTDLHLICAQLMASDLPGQPPLHIIMMDASETGSGVAPAVRGQHFSNHAALGGQVGAFELMDGALPIAVTSIGLRHADGAKRTLTDIDGEVDGLIQASVANHQRVLLIMIDVSKTGLIAPSPHYIAQLRARYPDQVDVLVDACQFRISSATLNAYLQLGCMVTLTGSKFLTGPVFSGILHIPAHLTPRLAHKKLPDALTDYSARAEWPAHWLATRHLSDQANWGLLLRLEAALAELRAFRAISEADIADFLEQFAIAMQSAIGASPHFALMAENRLSRSPIYHGHSWDQIPTIFPFLLLHRPGQPISREQTQQIYRQLQLPLQLRTGDQLDPSIAAMRCQLGQPVLCGTQFGSEVSALRLCASSRIIVEACSGNAHAAERIIDRALQALEKAAYLIQKMC